MNRQEHLLIILSEECDEVGQRASKALRFGLDEVKPEQTLTNAEMIIYEFNDILAVMEMLKEEGFIPKVIDREAIDKKKAKVNKYLQYSKQVGTLIESIKDLPLACFHNPEMICYACQHIGLPRKKSVFSTNKEDKRQYKQSAHCEKCDTQLAHSKIIFQNQFEEEAFKNQMTENGLAWMEK